MGDRELVVRWLLEVGEEVYIEGDINREVEVVVGEVGEEDTPALDPADKEAITGEVAEGVVVVATGKMLIIRHNRGSVVITTRTTRTKQELGEGSITWWR